MPIISMFPPAETPNHAISLAKLEAEILFVEDELRSLQRQYYIHWNAMNAQRCAEEYKYAPMDLSSMSHEFLVTTAATCEPLNLHQTVFDVLLHLPPHYQEVIRTAYGIDVYPGNTCHQSDTLQEEV
ncbi:hypothetical protein RE428_30760 [Marinobacter nanhaiticus D15-8W]|uniref:Uncharacterized protein n=1 Tax=Marinobacter nanhaiticus D15-8W TaxID=626887 RepID=N6X1A7_9GAMM|nr:hypothetical protein [Marinobacter nanhaiticus]ENO17192.1 hypothetical protein J057_00025 [Marinobacter nanhaiticus D15-8W]BES72058.1 hypothetical protein RE428_30760 [Marinobacter nanhaiticus D15-8W]